MVEGSKIDEFIKTNNLYSDNKLHRAFFRMMAEVKENIKGEPFPVEELERIAQKVRAIIDNKKMTINEEFNMIFVYRLSKWETENKKKIGRRERQDIGSELAKELGVEEIYNNHIPTYLLYQLGIMPKERIIPNDMRKDSLLLSPLKRKYRKIFQDFSDSDKRTITGFKREIYHVPPTSAKMIAKKALLALLITVAGLEAFDVGTMEFGVKAVEAQRYEGILADYETRMDDYAQDLKDMNLTDIQAIMKIINDVHQNTQGMSFYEGMGTDPALDTSSYFRLAVGDSEGYGVCRNFADHFTYVLNLYNPEFHAHDMLCELSNNPVRIANVERHQREYTDEEKEKYSEQLEQMQEEHSREDSHESTIHSANHMVTVIDVPGSDCRLVIDVLNPSIYLMVNNELVPLNNDEARIYYTPLTESVLGIDYQISAIKNLWSIKNTSKTEEEIA